MISTRMIKIFNTSIRRPLKLIFQSCLESEKANVVSLHKKGDKRILKNYRPISLLLLLVRSLKGYCMTRCLNFS